MSGTTAILLLNCTDQRGLVAAVSQFILDHGGNVIHADQHTDQEESKFVQRVEFELEGFGLARDEIAPQFKPIADRFNMDWSVRFSDQPARMAILVSRYGHCLYDLLSRVHLGETPATIPLVISNHADLESVAREFGVDYQCLPVNNERRADQEAAIDTLLREYEIDVVVLARYMQVLSDDFVSRHRNQIINIHHSFLPAFAGGRPYHQAHERGVKIIGATAHYVTAELDQGPIIEQNVVHVSHRDTVEDMIHKGRDLERVVLARAIHLHLEHRVVVYGNKTVVFD